MTTGLLIEDLLIAARTVWGEARGEPFAGQTAVAHVIVNRWQAEDGQFAADRTLAAACLRHKQFSCWNPNDPNFDKLFEAGAHDKAFRWALVAVLLALDEADPTLGARHYHALSAKPDWVEGHEPVFTAGAHLFYNDIE